MAIVIDDVGFDESIALEFANLGLPMTFAILPHQRYSLTLATRLRAMGHEVILHLPMQPVGYPGSDPGQGAVTEGLSRDEIRAIVMGDLDGVPGAVGLNNHMGSQATTDPVLMRAVLEVAKERGLFFLDSRTTSATIAYDLAVDMRIPATRRSVFLDDRRERSYIEAQVRSLLERARTEGSALAIGHPDEATLEALKESTGLLRSPDIKMVPASTLADAGNQEAG
ncbi:MAG TPA: divergent polysaccharide deacetylase family protein [Patescibacteria group bacterium]|nr:divergent polysaccharide deacetylase family protein [Patescibacteria group bacterium]